MATRHEQLRGQANELHRRHPEVWERFRDIAIAERKAGRPGRARWVWEETRRQLRIDMNNNLFGFYSERFNNERGAYFEVRRRPSKATAAKTTKPRDDVSGQQGELWWEK